MATSALADTFASAECRWCMMITIPAHTAAIKHGQHAVAPSPQPPASHAMPTLPPSVQGVRLRGCTLPDLRCGYLSCV
jgi:hypothetical protein